MTNLSGYIFLILAIILGITSNGFLKSTNGFTSLGPTIFCVISIIACIFCKPLFSRVDFPDGLAS